MMRPQNPVRIRGVLVRSGQVSATLQQLSRCQPIQCKQDGLLPIRCLVVMGLSFLFSTRSYSGTDTASIPIPFPPPPLLPLLTIIYIVTGTSLPCIISLRPRLVSDRKLCPGQERERQKALEQILMTAYLSVCIEFSSRHVPSNCNSSPHSYPSQQPRGQGLALP